ncbi:MAG: hypothetical protein WCS94_21375, partial [Verrucomicrobiota bacterium]
MKMKCFVLACLVGLSASVLLGADKLGAQLQGSFIWTGDVAPTDNNLHAGFRRLFALDTAPTRAQLHLFAYTRYQLFVNGDYVGR